MRRLLLLACASTGLAAAVACATSDVDAPSESPNDAIPNALPEGGSDDGGAADDGAVPRVPSCSDAGWCTTSLPDPDLTLKDIWPFESRAFAIAESPTQGVKILEWDDAVQKWEYIDDNTQNTFESGEYAGKIWAPNENELYYGVAPAFIYHGKRTAPSSPWSWQRSRLENNSRDTNPDRDPGVARLGPPSGTVQAALRMPPADFPALGVWGTSADDVYAWYANTIFHRTSESGGEATWVAEYIADDTTDLSDTFFLFSATGSSRDDVWFSGTRGRHANTGVFSCPLVVHKTAKGYRRLVDHTISGTSNADHTQGICGVKANALNFQFWSLGVPGLIPPGPMAYRAGGWLTSIASAGPNALARIYQGRHFAYVDAKDGGIARINQTTVRPPRNDTPSILTSVWVHETETWMSGWGLVLRMDKDVDQWSTGKHLTEPSNATDGGEGTYSVSTTVLGGAPLGAPLYQVRGTSNTNLWAIGARYALHKTTP